MLELITDNFDKAILVGTLIVGSLYIRFLLQLMGQRWIMTVSHTSTIVILPIITYIITSVISGNIALSLGMVGALSIVRFRNPVRSPLELSVYFGTITMGITASVEVLWLILLLCSVSLACATLYILNFLTLKFKGSSFFMMSFLEGNRVSSITIMSKGSIDFLENTELLINKIVEDQNHTYMLASSDYKKLQEIDRKLEGNEKIASRTLTK
ncbi:hypothetical protein ES708_20726 [subsurface metagenome]